MRGLGTHIDGVKKGMILNFDFNHSAPHCSRDSLIRIKCIKCIKAIAVHEFGHALGIGHEHNHNHFSLTELDNEQVLMTWKLNGSPEALIYIERVQKTGKKYGLATHRDGC